MCLKTICTPCNLNITTLLSSYGLFYYPLFVFPTLLKTINTKGILHPTLKVLCVAMHTIKQLPYGDMEGRVKTHGCPGKYFKDIQRHVFSAVCCKLGTM